MKKKSFLYFLIPIVALGCFIPIYWNYASHYEEQEAKRQAQIRQGKLNDLAEQDRLRLKAVQEANDAQEKRKKEKPSGRPRRPSARRSARTPCRPGPRPRAKATGSRIRSID